MTLGEGSTPLVLAERLSERVGAEVHLKLEGANPTGSFKDRGMTCAVSAAVREGAQAVICASTGNTAASAAAYAAKAGLRGVVIIPDGKIATGKLAQALVYGARVIALRGNFDTALELVRELADRHPIALVNSVNEFRLEGQKTASFELLEDLDGRIDALCIPVGNAGNITAYWQGFVEAGRGAAAVRLPGRGRGAARPRQARRGAGDDRERDPDRQPGALGGGDRRDARLARRRSAPSATRRSSPPTACSPPSEGVFCEPASAASVAGLLKYGADGAEVDRLRADRPRPEGPRHRARAGRLGRAVRAVAARDRARGAGVSAVVEVRVPASSANLGPGFDCFAAALDLHLELRVEAADAFELVTDLDVRARPLEPRGRGVRARGAGGRLALRDALGDPAGRRPRVERGGDAWRACWRARVLTGAEVDVLAIASEIEGHPDNAAAALMGGVVVCADGGVARIGPPARARRCSSCRRSRWRRRWPAARCPSRCRSPTRSSTPRTERC